MAPALQAGEAAETTQPLKMGGVRDGKKEATARSQQSLTTLQNQSWLRDVLKDTDQGDAIKIPRHGGEGCSPIQGFGRQTEDLASPNFQGGREALATARDGLDPPIFSYPGQQVPSQRPFAKADLEEAGDAALAENKFGNLAILRISPAIVGPLRLGTGPKGRWPGLLIFLGNPRDLGGVGIHEKQPALPALIQGLGDAVMSGKKVKIFMPA